MFSVYFELSEVRFECLYDAHGRAVQFLNVIKTASSSLPKEQSPVEVETM